MRNSGLVFVVAILGLGVAGSAHAGETITYTYDAQGRVIQVHSTGSVNGPSTTTYTYDKAHNRVTTTTVRS